MWKELVFKTWWTDHAGKTDAGGRFATGGFLGKYLVTVGDGRTRQVKTVVLDRKGATVIVTLRRQG